MKLRPKTKIVAAILVLLGSSTAALVYFALRQPRAVSSQSNTDTNLSHNQTSDTEAIEPEVISNDDLLQLVEQGLSDAQHVLGCRYFAGSHDIEQDHECAVYYFTLAANQGHRESACLLGTMHMNGWGTPIDIPAALHYLQIADNQYDATAPLSLAHIYLTGTYVKRDTRKAFNYTKIGSQRGSREAHHMVGVYYLNGIGTAPNAKLARKHFEDGAKVNYPPSIFELAKMYDTGATHNERQFLKPNPQRALELFRKAADLGEVGAMVELAYKLQEGPPETQNILESRRLFEEAATNGDSEAQFRHAMRLLDTSAPDHNPTIAAAWLHKSAAQDEPRAQIQLARLYLDGRGVEKDEAEALHWCEEAVKHGFDDAYYLYATMHHRGRGTPVSLPIAYAFYSLAAKYNNTEAIAARDTLLKSITPEQLEQGKELLKSIQETK